LIKQIRFYLPGILWAGFILLLCGLPGNAFPRTSFWSFLPVPIDKLAHVFFYFVLCMLLLWAQGRIHRAMPGPPAFAGVLLTALIYGIIIEVLQHTVFAGRGADGLDVVANMTGALLGCSLFLLAGRRYLLW
jgi:VanZ family protein